MTDLADDSTLSSSSSTTRHEFREIHVHVHASQETPAVCFLCFFLVVRQRRLPPRSARYLSPHGERGTELWSISELSLGERLLWLRGALHLDVLQPDLFLDAFVQGWSRSPAPRASPKHQSCGLRAGWYLFSSSCWSPASGFHIHALARHTLCATLMSESRVSEH